MAESIFKSFECGSYANEEIEEEKRLTICHLKDISWLFQIRTSSQFSQLFNKQKNYDSFN